MHCTHLVNINWSNKRHFLQLLEASSHHYLPTITWVFAPFRSQCHFLHQNDPLTSTLIWSGRMDYLHPHRSWFTPSLWTFFRFVPSNPHTMWYIFLFFMSLASWSHQVPFFYSPDLFLCIKIVFHSDAKHVQKCLNSWVVKIYLLCLWWVVLSLCI